MTQAGAEPEARVAAASTSPALRWLRSAFIRLGVLPFLLVIAVVVFTLLSDNFLTQRNLLNVARQSTYLAMVSLGQMFALLTGGFDLSVGTTLAITSVVGATAMAAAHAAMPDAVALAVALGLLAGFGAGLSIGIVNGIGVALFNVSPFMMTLGMASVGFGIALYLTGGVPVYGMPPEFGDHLRLRQLARHPRAGLRHRGVGRAALSSGQLDPPRALFLRRRRQHQGGPAVRHQHPADALHRLRAVRRHGIDRGAAADRPARDRRGQYRRLDAAGIDRRLRDRRRVSCAAASGGSRTWCWARCSSAWSRTA